MIDSKHVARLFFATAALFAVATILNLTSCVMPGDLEAIQNSQLALEEDIAAARVEYREGNITFEEYLEQMSEANAAHGEVIEEVATAVAERPLQAAETAGRFLGGMTGTELLGTVGALLGSGGLLYAKTRKDAVRVVNQERDAARKQKGGDYVPS